MKKIVFLFAVGMLTISANAQTQENFNARPQVLTSNLQAYLQQQCWQFMGMSVSGTETIEGNGALVSGTSATPIQHTGIYTQPLALVPNTKISFAYKFNTAVTARRWLKLSITDANNNLVATVDSVELTGKAGNSVYTYANTLNVQLQPAAYKLHINYQGVGTGSRIAIDELKINASTYYPTGCNQSPQATTDIIQGNDQYIASGNLLANDKDPNGESLTAKLVGNTNDGHVTLAADGSFTFTPKESFNGSSTSFTYIICDNGSPALCSNITTATIQFPTKTTTHNSLVDVNAAYNNGSVVIAWATAGEENNTHFEVERSTDGTAFKTLGNVPAQVNDNAKHNYTFSNEVGYSTICITD
jgi:hypothetical protein